MDTLTLDGLPARGADEQEEREAQLLLAARPTPPVIVNVRRPPPPHIPTRVGRARFPDQRSLRPQPHGLRVWEHAHRRRLAKTQSCVCIEGGGVERARNPNPRPHLALPLRTQRASPLVRAADTGGVGWCLVQWTKASRARLQDGTLRPKLMVRPSRVGLKGLAAYPAHRHMHGTSPPTLLPLLPHTHSRR